MAHAEALSGISGLGQTGKSTLSPAGTPRILLSKATTAPAEERPREIAKFAKRGLNGADQWALGVNQLTLTV